MLPFNFLGQDTGSLLFSVSGIVYSAISPFTYVLVNGASGPILVYPYPVINLPIPAIEQANFSISLAGDFFGFYDDGIYTAAIPSGDIYGGVKEQAYLSYSFGGFPSGIPYDKPYFTAKIDGSTSGTPLDKPYYTASINYGLVTGILLDRPSFAMRLDGYATGIPFDKPDYRLSLDGRLNRIYSESENMLFAFTGGAVQRGRVLHTQELDDGFNIDFGFVGGKTQRA